MSKEEKCPALELRSKGFHGNGSSTGTFYQVEIRSTSTMPTVVGDRGATIPFVIDNYWRALPIMRGATAWGVNIPICSWDGEIADHGLVSYVAAEAHRWAFLAALEAGVGGAGGALCIETRLVAVEFHKEYRTKELGVSPPTGFAYKPAILAPRSPSDVENTVQGK